MISEALITSRFNPRKNTSVALRPYLSTRATARVRPLPPPPPDFESDTAGIIRYKLQLALPSPIRRSVAARILTWNRDASFLGISRSFMLAWGATRKSSNDLLIASLGINTAAPNCSHQRSISVFDEELLPKP